jgi:hypothetical protein
MRAVHSLLPLFGALACGCAAAPESENPSPGPSGTSSSANDGPPVVGTTEPPEPVDADVGFAGLVCPEVTAVPNEGRLLTRAQYNNSVRDLFAGRLQADYARPFPPENQVLGFATNAEFHRASPLLAEKHMTVAETIATDALPLLGELLPCSTTSADRSCAEAFVDDFGLRAFRRPLSGTERELMLGLYDDTVAVEGFTGAVRLLIEAFLQSPQFLYRFESGSAPVVDSTGAAVAQEPTDYELASRLSYLLWNTMPDAALFQAAAEGRLRVADGLLAEAGRMLDDPRMRDGVSDFYRQFLKLDRLKGVARDLDGVPTDHGDSWRYSLDYFTSHVFSNEGGNLKALLTSPTVFLNDALAPLYGVAVPDGLAPGQFFRLDMGVANRSGLLSQPALMALYAHPEQSAPIQRGVFVRDALLCQPPPPPPPTVNNNPPDPDPSLTTRERFAVHTEAPECATCHQLIDPIGLALDEFDQLGRHRETENGIAVDTSGEIVGVREDAILGPFDGTAELGERLSTSVQVQQCLVTQWYRYGMGRVEQQEDLCSMKAAFDRFVAADGSMEELLLGIVASDAFRFRIPAPEVTP